MALMGSSEWNHTQTTSDDEFHQFLNLADVAAADGDAMSFDFDSFADPNNTNTTTNTNNNNANTDTTNNTASNPHSHSLPLPLPDHQHQQQHQHHRIMSQHSIAMPKSPMDAGVGVGHEAVTNIPTTTIAAPVMSLPLSQTDRRLSELEAQIRILREQHHQHEENQRRAQHASFMTSPAHAAHALRIPPTPRSLEMPPTTTSAAAMSQFYSHGGQRMMDAFHALADVHDVCIALTTQTNLPRATS